MKPNRIALVMLLILSTAGAMPAFGQSSSPDRIVVLGDTLRGRVSRFTAEYVELSTRYGRGHIEVPFDSIQSVTLVGDYVVLYDESNEVRGPVIALVGDTLFFGAAQDSIVVIELKRIRSGIALEDFGDTWLDRMRRRWRYWSGGLDVAWEVEDGAIIKRKIDAGIHLERRKEPTRILGDHRQKFEAQRASDDSSEATTKDEFRSLVLGEYDLSNRYYVFVLVGAERDRPRRIEIRAHPNGGLGRRFVDSERLLLQAGVGVAYVWEEFVGFTDNQYLGVHFTGEYRWRTKLGPVLSGRISYTPDLSESQWLFRSEFALDYPIIELLSLRLRVTNVSDNNPAPSVGNNKVTTNLALAVDFP